ncbi:hypothetical protein, partial [Pantoea septica]|uniref:hypothetical protein n=1 Tax=Pantoea septica TaxID=472695 RepID=UPI002FD8EE8A
AGAYRPCSVARSGRNETASLSGERNLHRCQANKPAPLSGEMKLPAAWRAESAQARLRSRQPRQRAGTR